MMPCGVPVSSNTRSLVDDVHYKRDNIQTLRLSKTKGASANNAEPVKDAHALLIDITDSLEIGEFDKQENGIWTLEYEPIYEHTYRLEVTVPGYDSIYAEQTIPAQIFGENFDFSKSAWIHVLCINDNAVSIVEEVCTDLEVDNFNLTGGTYDPYGSYIDYDYAYKHAPFYPELTEKSMHFRYLRVPGGTLTADEEDSSVWDWDISFNNIDYKADYIIEYNYVSDDYDRYLREAVQYYRLYNESTDLTSIYLRDELVTNVHGAIGVFGAKVCTRREWWMPGIKW